MLRQMTVEGIHYNNELLLIINYYLKENLLFSARTRLPDGMSDTLRTKQVNAVIEVLGLKGNSHSHSLSHYTHSHYSHYSHSHTLSHSHAPTHSHSFTLFTFFFLSF